MHSLDASGSLVCRFVKVLSLCSLAQWDNCTLGAMRLNVNLQTRFCGGKIRLWGRLVQPPRI